MGQAKQTHKLNLKNAPCIGNICENNKLVTMHYFVPVTNDVPETVMSTFLILSSLKVTVTFELAAIIIIPILQNWKLRSKEFN